MTEKDLFLMHYGTKEHSGRYPWGSGENPYQRLAEGSIRARYKELEDSGMSHKEILSNLNMSDSEWRAIRSMEISDEKLHRYYRIQELHEKGYSNVKIAEMLNCTEGTVRNDLKTGRETKVNSLRNIIDNLQTEVDSKKYIDVGKGVEYSLNCSETRKKVALKYLQSQGYDQHNIYVNQMGTTHKTTMTVLCKPGTDIPTLYKNLDKIRSIDESRVIMEDGKVKLGALKPKSVDRSRIMVRYAEEGGADRDGTIELRRGVDDISLGNAHHVQARIAVDGKGYMKGMAFYSDNMPPGVDIIYNTNKKKGAPDFGEGGVFKDLKKDAANPFGATIKGLHDEDLPDDKKELKLTQRMYTDKDGKQQLSCINVVNEEGDWGGWSKTLSSQFLSKQPVQLAKQQLDLSFKQSQADFEKIMKLTEPTVKKALLEEFADSCDAAACDLKAAALPRQSSYAILPVTTLKDNEIYAPKYNNGEHVCLLRYPHGGTFEIPELVVNNNHKEGKAIVGTAQDAVGININVAKILSGADFDGDTVTIIPSDNVRIKSADPKPSKAIQDLRDFDPNDYSYPPGVKHEKMKENVKQIEMGKITNLIADMTLMGAPEEDIVRATKHSMVVIDAVKHDLNYKQSAKDFGIAELKKKYRGSANAGAGTIITRASHEVDIQQRSTYYKVDPDTGEKIYKETGKMKDKKVNGEWVKNAAKVTEKVPMMSITKDAMELTSDGKGGNAMETVYARYANNQKMLANRARKEALAVEDRPYSEASAKTYENELKSLKASLMIAKKNAPRERQAQRIANSRVAAELETHPEWKEDKDKIKKLKGEAIAAARSAVGAKKEQIHFTDKEWEAIQSGAVRKTMLREIIANADKDEVKQRAMPKTDVKISRTVISTAKAMLNAGFTQAEIADRLGISASTVNKIANE